jgi:hypothetical protein
MAETKISSIAQNVSGRTRKYRLFWTCSNKLFRNVFNNFYNFCNFFQKIPTKEKEKNI